ncbi:MAG: hypothetical protein MJY56_06455 [Bacteroidales bacterium]|nr:hypothetical protein [Bacteroidales bacterium]
MKKSISLLIAFAAMAYSLNAQDIVTTRGTYSAGSEPFVEYATDLLYANERFEAGKFYDDIYRGVEVETDMEFTSFKELVAAIPALPSAKQIISSPEEGAAELAEFAAACGEFVTGQLIKAAAMQQSALPATASSMPAISPEMMALANMDVEKMSQEELMAIAMKMAAQRQAAGAGVVAAPDYSEEQDEAIDDVSDRLDEINEKVTEYVMTYSMTGNALGLSKQLSRLYNELVEAWPASEECARIGEIEKDIDGKALKYFKDKHIYDYTNERFPQSWYDGRKEQNEIIAAYNMPAAIRWRKTVQTALDDAKPILDEMVAIDEKLENTFTDKRDSIYRMLKQRVCQAFQSYMPLVTVAMSYVYDYPVICSVSETNDIGQ